MVSSGIGNRIKQTASYPYMIARRYNHPHEQVELSQNPARLSNNKDLQEDEKRH
jgi:hypothetical protein